MPSTGTYRITAAGSAGGTQFYQSDYPGGMGASMSGEFSLTQGTVLKILVGQKGEDTRDHNQDNAAPGGGGGSFIWISASNSLLIAAGGGGGGGRQSSNLKNANTTQNGNSANALDNGGSNGNGGRRNNYGSSYWAGGGSGWNTNGTSGNNPSDYSPNVYGGYGSAGGGVRPVFAGTTVGMKAVMAVSVVVAAVAQIIWVAAAVADIPEEEEVTPLIGQTQTMLAAAEVLLIPERIRIIL